MKQTLLFLLAALPVFALPTGAPPGNTGAPGNLVCTACHRSFALNPEGGSVRIQAVNYKPGQAQTLRVTVSHPEAVRWGFQIAARWAKDPTQNAGRFNAPNADVQIQQAGVYATHTAAGTLTNGANGAKTFEVEWVAPEGADDSDVIFYAAGNAANNNATGTFTGNTGDRIYTTETRIQADVSCAFTERPVITELTNGASFRPGASAGSILTIKGRNFAAANTSRVAALGYVRDNNFPKELGCVAVEIGGQRAPVLYVASGQINVQVPALTALGDVPVRVIMNANGTNALTSDPATARLQATSPAFFTFNGSTVAALVAGTGTYVAQPAVVPGARAARPGEIVELYATGLGATQTVVAPGALAPNQAISTTQKPTITLGGTRLNDADVLYSGLAPGNISGLYQINVRIPASAGNGDLPITMAVGSDQSIAGTTIPVNAQ
jgi:uncharacterized protein (TIGR03437 family)